MKIPASRESSVTDAGSRKAGSGVPRGFARPVDGGYIIPGNWAYRSAISHAESIHAGFCVTDPSGKDMVI